MSGSQQRIERLAERSGVRVVETTADRVVVEQPAVRELDNHVGVRHASALFVAAHEAARLLVLEALRGADARAEPFLIDSEISYETMPVGTITSTAEPTGEAWGPVIAGHRDDADELVASVISSNSEGKTVTSLVTRWRLGPPPRDLSTRPG